MNTGSPQFAKQGLPVYRSEVWCVRETVIETKEQVSGKVVCHSVNTSQSQNISDAKEPGVGARDSARPNGSRRQDLMEGRGLRPQEGDTEGTGPGRNHLQAKPPVRAGATSGSLVLMQQGTLSPSA